MKRFLRTTLGLVLLAASTTALAGTRPLQVVFINIGSFDLYKTKFYRKYLDFQLADTEKPGKCWGDRLGNGDEKSVFSLITRMHLPDGLDKDVARKVWAGDAASTTASRRILARDFEIEPGVFIGPRGYDGMYVFDSDGRTITMMSVGAHGGVSKKIEMRLDEAHPEQTASEFSYSLCTIAGPIMTGYGT